jgi:tRNA (guanosine-2'-O-)-methyltransferase
VVYPAADVVAALAPCLSEARRTRMDEVLAARIGSVALALEDLHHSHNAVACLRTADALGVQDVVAVETSAPFPLDAEAGLPKRVSRSAHRWLDLHPVADAAALRAWADARGMRIYAAGPRADVSLEGLPAGPLLLLFGNELEGVRPETRDACDGTFRIPMAGFAESLNVSVCVGIALYTLLARVRAGLGGAGDLPPERVAALRAVWYASDVRMADAVLRRRLGSGVAP